MVNLIEVSNLEYYNNMTTIKNKIKLKFKGKIHEKIVEIGKIGGMFKHSP